MNIEFDAYKQKLNDCRPALEGLADSLNLEGLRFACRARSVGGAFSRTISWRPACAAGRTLRGALRADLLMPQEALFARGAHSMQAVMHRALLRRGRSGRLLPQN